MASIDPTGAPIPFQVARAYGGSVRPVATTRPTHVPDTRLGGVNPTSPGPARSQGIARLVAAAVPGGVEFSGDGPVASPGALSLYRHPADRNVAATGVVVGRSLDVEA